MKKIIVRSVFSAMFSVSVCMLFLGGIIPGLSLRGGIPCAFAASFAGSLLAATASRTGRGETGGKKEEKAGTPDGRPDRESSAAAPGAAGKRGYEVYLRVQICHQKKNEMKNINYYAGRNFRQFVNWYRIQHAIGLLKEDPHLKMEDVSTLSGFHTTVSFNMAFRLFEGKTPTQWLEEYVDSLRKR